MLVKAATLTRPPPGGGQHTPDTLHRPALFDILLRHRVVQYLPSMRDSEEVREVLRRVRAVPAGCVTTYGDICSRTPRFAGAVLAGCEDPNLPWHRIVRADGSLAKGDRQLRLLKDEGVAFRGTRVEMDRAWVDVATLIG